MNLEIPSVVGLRKEDAVKILESKGIKVLVRETKPPRGRLKGEPVGWRVISQRESDEKVELVVTPEWIAWLTPNASEKTGK
ncbi:MAG: PASTA domain-containing protein [Armatimonadetes bacterium]|nr:PASTA domain-containing protein [Armatimonadota bacterium]MCX7967185.1 PASTA domain-containing protein [Armatimonadota bacterium]MDW8143130.1 PASTA domain-containing protein [Armatimonadota bacterium]